MIFSVPKVKTFSCEKQEEPLKKEINKNLEEVKRKNLLKYQAVVMKYIENINENDIAKKLGTSYSAVNKWITKFQLHGDVSANLSRSGRKTNITKPIKDFIKESLSYDPEFKVKELSFKLQEEFQVKISPKSIYRYL